jgi:hypothetical protein
MAHVPDPRRDQAGMALLIAILMLLMISAIGVAAIDHSGDESEVAGHERRTTITFYAADAGIQYARTRVFTNPPNLDEFEVALTDGTTFRSGTRDDGAATELDAPDIGAPPDGFSINVGGAGGFVSENLTVNVTAAGGGNSTVELETRLSQTVAGYGRY